MGVVAAVLVAVLALALVGGGGGDPASGPAATTGPTSVPATSTSDPPGAVPQVAVGGTLERVGEDLVARVTVTNGGAEQVWVPIGPAGTPRPRLVPAAAGAGIVDVGLVVPPAPGEVEGVTPALTFRPVAPGATLDLDVTDAPPPPEALIDEAGRPVEITGYRLCVDAFADAALPAGERDAVEATDDVAVAVAAIDGESSRTCGPDVPA